MIDTVQYNQMIKFYSQYVFKDALCFDIGANVGNRVSVFLSLQSKVIAVEPQPQCCYTLNSLYSQNKNFTLIPMALGSQEGITDMMICDASTISSLSKEWIDKVKQSGRFANHNWYATQKVQLTTIDNLIIKYGVPSFIKIDVEGYEYEVIKGMTHKCNVLSLEFTPEYIESTFNCIQWCAKLGKIKLNYCVGENMKFELNEWIDADKMIHILQSFKNDNILFGDVYIKFD